MEINVYPPLKSARKRLGKTQADLADAAGVSQAHISALEIMKERASPALAEKLVELLGRANITEEQILYPDRYMANQTG